MAHVGLSLLAFLQALDCCLQPELASVHDDGRPVRERRESSARGPCIKVCRDERVPQQNPDCPIPACPTNHQEAQWPGRVFPNTQMQSGQKTDPLSPRALMRPSERLCSRREGL